MTHAPHAGIRLLSPTRSRSLIAGLLSVALVMGVEGKTPACADTNTVQALRTELALTQLQAELLREKSATKVLEAWCGRYQIADQPVVRAEVQTAEAKPPSAETMNRLQVQNSNEVAYRRVALRCGTVVLSEADNWYVPARLTKAMNAMLASSDVPFGKVIAELRPFRVTIDAKPLWSALDQGRVCAVQDLDSAPPPKAVLQLRALLYREDLKPFSEVHEVYQRPLLDAASQCAP
ncbi:hypothetical protein C7S18_06930 [Ahniella affigens]|uniref:Chorismate lyase n=1 Tax=Ahniella affigens TaxID=2021234 RepID=A0A2P1PQ24_9GAMM|nr:hypothetical protein [Ahniella affigens]AVP96947.1 hypothetical protein C7S18_06930 [Ahniella affigens]